jgi:polysaccharide pyruvyl transferase WcaK-like protein
MRFSKKFYLSNNIAVLLLLSLVLKVLPGRRIRRWVTARNMVLRRIDEGDLFACMSGGDSFSDIYGLRRFIAVSLPQVLVLLLGKRLVLLPQTLGPYKSSFARRVAKYILKGAEVIYSRDHAGPGLVRQMLGAAHGDKVRFSPDVAFVLESRVPKQVDVHGLTDPREERPLVGVNVSGLLYMGGYSRNNMFHLKHNYETLISELVHFLISQKNADVLLIPHVFGADGEGDPPACEALYDKFRTAHPNRIGLVRGRYDQSEIKHIIGQCDFFIGSRMHACIAALSQYVPAVAIAYSDKFQGVFETAGVDALVADVRRTDEFEIVALVERAFGSREAWQKHLQQRIPKVQEAVLGLFVFGDQGYCSPESFTRARAESDLLSSDQRQAL